MADVTGGDPPIGSSEFNPPLHFDEVYKHFGDPEMFAVANAAALPASGNWLGRMLMTSDTGFVYRWTGAAWKVVAGDTGNVALTLESGWTGSSTYRVVNGMASMNGRLDATSGAGAVVTVVPAVARPASERVTLGIASGLLQTIIIQPSGNVTLFGKSGAVSDLRLASIPPWAVG